AVAASSVVVGLAHEVGLRAPKARFDGGLGDDFVNGTAVAHDAFVEAQGQVAANLGGTAERVGGGVDGFEIATVGGREQAGLRLFPAHEADLGQREGRGRRGLRRQGRGGKRGEREQGERGDGGAEHGVHGRGGSDFVGGEPAELGDLELAAEAAVFVGGQQGGNDGGVVGGGVGVVGRALHDGLAPGAAGDFVGGGVADLAVGANAEGVAARGEQRRERLHDVGLGQPAGDAVERVRGQVLDVTGGAGDGAGVERVIF